jgi:hypothetical protein
MQGMMQPRQLLISTLIEHAAQNHGETEVGVEIDLAMRPSDRAT